MALEIRFLLERLHVVPVISREHPPVHERRIVARRVRAILMKLGGRSPKPGAMPPIQPPLCQKARRKLVALEPANIIRAKKFVAHGNQANPNTNDSTSPPRRAFPTRLK